MEDVKINLLLAVHDELQKLKHVMMNEFKRLRQVMSPPVEITKAVKINGDEGLAVLGCSIFASSSRNNELFKETIDVSNDEALIAQFWISNVAHKTHWHANSAPSRPNQSHEPFTPTPKKLSQEEPVSAFPCPALSPSPGALEGLGETSVAIDVDITIIGLLISGKRPSLGSESARE
ncbi:hypothetical protein Bca52824_083454 [Brassica carinata]|uniref:Uncharacterized protein n=1 Tax=Brassica carinata TaxID=52824 RepID=A0A8X7PM01_BRACI|nr:hypothetical protein Bca52824_083454 [Brassica carinata]